MTRGALMIIDWIAASMAAPSARVRAAEGQRRVVAVEDGHRPARADHARGLREHRERVADVADQGVGHDGVEARGRQVERVRVADDELDAVADAVVGGEPLGGGDEVRALVDPVTVPAKPSRAAIARATTPVPQPRSRTAARGGRSMQLQVRLAVGHERRIAGAELEPLDESLARRGVLLVDELHRVADLERRHRRLLRELPSRSYADARPRASGRCLRRSLPTSSGQTLERGRSPLRAAGR